MVNELQEEKKMMEELVRSSMTPASAPVTPQDELHIVEQPAEQQLEQSVEQQHEEQQPEEQPVEPLTQQTSTQVPISAEDFFTQPAPA